MTKPSDPSLKNEASAALQRVNVIASCSAFGVFSKEARGVLSDQGRLPPSLNAAKAAAARVASRLGIDLSVPPEALRAELSALSSRLKMPPQARVARGPSDGLDLG